MRNSRNEGKSSWILLISKRTCMKTTWPKVIRNSEKAKHLRWNGWETVPRLTIINLLRTTRTSKSGRSAACKRPRKTGSQMRNELTMACDPSLASFRSITIELLLPARKRWKSKSRNAFCGKIQSNAKKNNLSKTLSQLSRRMLSASCTAKKWTNGESKMRSSGLKIDQKKVRGAWNSILRIALSNPRSQKLEFPSWTSAFQWSKHASSSVDRMLSMPGCNDRVKMRWCTPITQWTKCMRRTS